MQREVVCVNCCGDGVFPASMEGQRRLRKSMVLYGAVYAILVHERLRVAQHCAGQYFDSFCEHVGCLCAPKRKCAANTELAAVRH